jgi:hypothetical protein
MPDSKSLSHLLHIRPCTSYANQGFGMKVHPYQSNFKTHVLHNEIINPVTALPTIRVTDDPAYTVFVGPEGKRPPGSPRHRCMLKCILKDIG